MRDRVVEIYENLVAGFEDIKVKGKKTRYTALNGNMFSFVAGDGVLCIRLSEARKKEFNGEHGQGDVIQYGAVMRGYVAVSYKLLGDAVALKALFAEAVEHVLGLKPKPTKRK